MMTLKDRYMIEKELGRGGMGVVYLAQDSKLHSRKVVVKVLLETSLNSKQEEWFRRKFLQEIEALARIDHPGIVGVLDTDLTPDGKPFIVMQYVEGVILRSVLDDNPRGLDAPRAARLLRQIGDALNAAHEKGVIHRDLKPENIMLQTLSGGEEQVKLIDFGIATVKESQVAADKNTTAIAGTVHYMAPEQLHGSPSAASDVYAMGVIAYEMLTGKLPFNPPSPYQLLEMQRDGVKVKPLDLRPSLPIAAQEIILNALSFDEKDRCRLARDFGETLAQTLTVQHSPLELAHVLFMDLIGYSVLAMAEQTRLLRHLQSIVRNTSAFRRAQENDELISLPTGDGMALVFFRNPVAPVKCAVEISGALRDSTDVKLRMGIHAGPVYRLADIKDNENVAGGGINLAQRVMDCGDAGHILLSKSAADILIQLGNWGGYLHDLGEHKVKHGVGVHLFNLYGGEIGNSEWPGKLRITEIPGPAGASDLIRQLISLNHRGGGNFGLQLWVEDEADAETRPVRDFEPDEKETPRFRLGDKAVICAAVVQDCYLWILVVGTTGRSAVIFPRGDLNTHLTAGQTLRIPGKLTGAPGLETVHAFATAGPLPPEVSPARPLSPPSVDLLMATESALLDSQRTSCMALTIQFVVGE